MRKNVTIYPYDGEFTPILRSNKFNEKYNVIAISSLFGWGLCNKDAGYADGGGYLNIKVDNKFEEHLEESDTIIFIKPEHQIDLDKFIYPKIIAAIDKGKDIVCLLEINKTLLKIEEYANSRGVTFEKIIENDFTSNSLSKKSIININVPVIFIAGISENTNKFLLQVKIKDELDALGYKSVLIGSKPYCEIIDDISFPTFMFENNMSEADKIYSFNNFVKDVEIKNEPDLIIIGIPGGLMSYSRTITNYFGITAFEVSQAVKPDFTIMSLYYDLYTSEYFCNIEKFIKYRYGFEVDMFNIVNKKIDSNEMQYANNKIHTFTLNTTYIKQQMEKIRALSNKECCNIIGDNSANRVVQCIVEDLTECNTGIVF